MRSKKQLIAEIIALHDFFYIALALKLEEDTGGEP